MPKKQQAKEKQIKAWTIYDRTDDDISSEMYESKHLVQEFIRSVAYDKSPSLMKEYLKRIRKNYKIIPVTITYTLPTKKSKK